MADLHTLPRPKRLRKAKGSVISDDLVRLATDLAQLGRDACIELEGILDLMLRNDVHREHDDREMEPYTLRGLTLRAHALNRAVFILLADTDSVDRHKMAELVRGPIGAERLRQSRPAAS